MSKRKRTVKLEPKEDDAAMLTTAAEAPSTATAESEDDDVPLRARKRVKSTPKKSRASASSASASSSSADTNGSAGSGGMAGDLEALTVKALKDLCRNAGLPVSGDKHTLIDRIRTGGTASASSANGAAESDSSDEDAEEDEVDSFGAGPKGRPAKAKAEPKAKAKAKAEPRAKAEPKSKAKVKAETKVKVKAESKKAKVKAESKSKAKGKAKPKAKGKGKGKGKGKRGRRGASSSDDDSDDDSSEDSDSDEDDGVAVDIPASLHAALLAVLPKTFPVELMAIIDAYVPQPLDLLGIDLADTRRDRALQAHWLPAMVQELSDVLPEVVADGVEWFRFEAALLIAAVGSTRVPYGVGTPVAGLRGSKSQAVAGAKMKYKGAGMHRSDEYWKQMHVWLFRNSYLDPYPSRYAPCYYPSEKGKAVLAAVDMKHVLRVVATRAELEASVAAQLREAARTAASDSDDEDSDVQMSTAPASASASGSGGSGGAPAVRKPTKQEAAQSDDASDDDFQPDS